MRQYQSIISAFSNLIAELGNRLIVCGDATRSLGASSLSALQLTASRWLRDALRHGPSATWVATAHVRTVHPWQHKLMCCPAVA